MKSFMRGGASSRSSTGVTTNRSPTGNGASDATHRSTHRPSGMPVTERTRGGARPAASGARRRSIELASGGAAGPSNQALSLAGSGDGDPGGAVSTETPRAPRSRRSAAASSSIAAGIEIATSIQEIRRRSP
ncbi:MAG: hypothetical protein HY049_10825 [Acidobacteria bacterium]|nr:hypothetical protein [Acidobacteriota bacterium]